MILSTIFSHFYKFASGSSVQARANILAVFPQTFFLTVLGPGEDIVPFAFSKVFDTLAIEFVINELAFVSIAVCKVVDTIAIKDVIFELAFVSIAVCKVVDTIAIKVVIFELAFVSIAACKV
jgi:hypothetical protein